MIYRELLAPLFADAQGEAALATALQLAKHFRACQEIAESGVRFVR